MVDAVAGLAIDLAAGPAPIESIRRGSSPSRLDSSSSSDLDVEDVAEADLDDDDDDRDPLPEALAALAREVRVADFVRKAHSFERVVASSDPSHFAVGSGLPRGPPGRIVARGVLASV